MSSLSAAYFKRYVKLERPGARVGEPRVVGGRSFYVTGHGSRERPPRGDVGGSRLGRTRRRRGSIAYVESSCDEEGAVDAVTEFVGAIDALARRLEDALPGAGAEAVGLAAA